MNSISSGCFAFTFFVCQLLSLNVLAQPGELDRLKNQLQQIQAQISELGADPTDPFGQRVRSIGRQRQTAPPPVEIDEVLQIRFYDLSDIFSVSPQYPARLPQDLAGRSALLFPTSSNSMTGGGFGGGGGGVFSIPPRQAKPETMSLESARISVNTLVEAIQNTVEPDQWSTQGGDAKIILLGNTLLISATDSMHVRIVNLINLFRELWGKLRTVSVQAFWIQSDAATIAQLVVSDSKSNPVVGLVEEAKWDRFFEDADQAKRIPYSAAVTGHNGQTLHALSGRQRHFVTDARSLNSVLINKHGDENAFVAGLAPVRSTLNEGAALQVTPLATRGGNFVVLDLHTRVNEAVTDTQSEENRKTKTATASAVGPKGETFSVELENAEYVAYRMSTTIRCPKDQIILAGGMTYDEQLGSEYPNLYLFVRTRVHTIEEDRSDVSSD